MSARSRTLLALAIAAAAALAAFAAPASAAPARAAWKLSLLPIPANLAPGEEGELELRATNVGGAPSDGTEIEIQTTLPDELQVVAAAGRGGEFTAEIEPQCTISGQEVTCDTTQEIVPSDLVLIRVFATVSPATPAGPIALAASVAGGGTPANAAASELTVSPDPLFGFLGPLTAPLTNADGSAATEAGGHPTQYTVDFNFPTTKFSTPAGEDLLKVADPANTVITDLPPGLIANPAASPILCTEAQLSETGGFGGACPPESQVGVIDLLTTVGGSEGTTPYRSALYSMVPPPGAPAALAFSAGGAGILVHLIAGVDSEGDYSAYTEVRDALAHRLHPLFGAQAQIWGDPSSKIYELSRGSRNLPGIVGGPCRASHLLCPAPDQPTAFLTNPVHCTGTPEVSRLAASTWGAPDVFSEESYESADLDGNEATISGCSAVQFKPTIAAKPTTNLTDSPSGLDFTLHQPQDLDKTHTATGQLKDASVTLPAGMSVNPSQADGLAGCSPAQIGMITAVGESPAHFSKQPNSCPDAAKLGTVEVTTPLLAQRNEKHELVTDPETGRPLPEPLHGSVYLAEPYQNPFGSLLAIYLAVEDPKTGTVAKLAGRIEPDPASGQLTTVFTENPQLPLEDIKLHLFGGARGSLITPPSCGPHTTTTSLVPWSAPETPTATPSDTFAAASAPAGPCAASASQLPNSPSLTAGTLTPLAGAYSPFVLKISREDGTQRLTGIDTMLPPGLSGKLAGIGQCTEAQIAAARAREHPREGSAERGQPSCPASAEVGTVVVGAGAGPTPFYTSGHAYLAGPYKGAPVSLAVIVPAIAGPFDLGTVVSRVALHVEPESARIHAVSDPLPQIIEGIPLDLRSVALKMDRPQFTLNPTSCDPMAITGAASAPFGPAAALSVPFQVGGCSALPFKPKLSLRLKGSVKRSSNPRLIANLTARPGEANVARAQVKLPHPVFLDQSHIRTVCTRVQFAADQCPAGSVYGKVQARTPLLDQPLSGSVYLRSSSHQLPDLVAKLRGPDSLPIEIDLVGKTDAVKGALRNTFEAVPDAPVSSFRLELFGGKRGLVEMSEGFCSQRRATVNLDAQNGKTHDTRPVVAAKCPKHKKGNRHRPRRRVR
jgi:hypothetical protein